MNKTLLIAISFLGLSASSVAQVANFDGFELDSTGVWNGADGTGNYSEEGFEFSNFYDDAWGSWSGFSVSSILDNATAGWANQFGVSSGAVYSGDNFAVATMGATIFTDARVIDGFYITNTTYAALSMLNGDEYAKKFGGESGDDADWFKLSVIGKLDSTVTDTVEFYLADFRFEDNTEDYILTEWTWLDLNALGNVTEVSFEWSSSDNGDWGMNTPAYFCMEDITVNTVGVEELATETLTIYPNPANDYLKVNREGELTIYDLSGRLVKSQTVEAVNSVSVSDLNNGIYFVKVGSEVKKIVKL